MLIIKMNVVKEVSEMLEEQERFITKGMTESELKAYKLGVSNTLSGISAVLVDEDEPIAVIHEDTVELAYEVDDVEIDERYDG